MNPSTLPDSIRFGTIVLPDRLSSAFALERTRMVGQITGSLSSILVEQHFRNDLDQSAEIEYLFPLPEKAAVFSFDMKIGERVIRGEIQESQQAREHYEEARRRGQHAALVEQRRKNLFAVRVANVLPGKPVSVRLRYTEPLRYLDGEWEFVFPMGLTPRYNAPGHSQEAQGVNFPSAHPGEEIGPVEVNLSVNCGGVCGQPASPSHALAVTQLDEHRFEVTLAEPAIPDHDLVLRLPLHIDEQAALDGYVYETPEGAFFHCNILPDRMGDMHNFSPREFVFVLDRSGSMMGEPIAQARNALRACLRTLNQMDTFRILLFDHETEWYRLEPAEVTQAEIDAADQFLAGVEGRGGTEIISALEAALGLPADKKRTRYVVFLTDGAVSAEDRALNRVRKLIGETRLFTFGIGPSVNRALLRDMAESGHGTAEFLQSNEDIEGAIIRFQDRVSYAALTNVQVGIIAAEVIDQYPRQLSDLYYGDAITFSGRMKIESGKPVLAELTGMVGCSVYTGTTQLQTVQEPAIARAWARAQIDELAESAAAGRLSQKKCRARTLELALRYQLLSAYTSFVAIDDEVVARGGSPLVIAVAQPLPQGLDFTGFGGPVGAMPMARAAMFSMPAPTSGDMNAMAAPPTPQARRKGVAENRAAPASALPDTVEGILRHLARTQKINGSWNNDVELTSAALLAFFRHGHTDRIGSYRRQISNALSWLNAAPAAGLAAEIRAAVLAELKQGPAVAPQPADKPVKAASLADLRGAALANRLAAVSPALLNGKDEELARIWQACITQE